MRRLCLALDELPSLVVENLVHGAGSHGLLIAFGASVATRAPMPNSWAVKPKRQLPSRLASPFDSFKDPSLLHRIMFTPQMTTTTHP